jgi:hypothetical protein
MYCLRVRKRYTGEHVRLFADEEDAYEPEFESEEKEREFFRNSIPGKEKKALFDVCSIQR